MSIFVSSRDENLKVDSAEAIIEGLAKDGGLYTPVDINSKINLNQILTMDYQQIATVVLQKIFNDIDPNIIKNVVSSAYTSSFDTDEITPLVKVGDDYLLELWHGPTCAFKDIALTLLPHLLTQCYAIKGIHKKIVILTATSGDTGKAALEGFKDVDNIYIKVLYPHNLVSITQQQQMVTTTGQNTEVLSVEGNFDDCQRIVKNMLEKPKEYDHLQLSSANSINIGRLAPQIVYYFKSYADLVRNKEIHCGDLVDFIVPTGNFGDILAGYLAKQLGLPVGNLVCASNINNVLTEFFETGVYNANRQFHNTIAPSIDILVSSNLERLLYLISKDANLVSGYMKQLKETGTYTIDPALLAKIKESFIGIFSDETEVAQTIHDYYQKYNYLIDPHTAVACCAAEKYQSVHKKVILSTASPYKFSQAVYQAITGKSIPDDLNCINTLYQFTKKEVPQPLTDLQNKKIRFKEVLAKDDAETILWQKLEELNHD